MWRQDKAREGDERLSGNQAGERKRAANCPPHPGPPRIARRQGHVVGRALRTVYDETLREEIPNDFLDLLGKLA